LLRDFDWSTAVRGVNPLRLMIDRLQTAGRVKTLSLQAAPPHWYLPVRDPEDMMQAEDLLLRSGKNIYEGWIDRYFNRKVSVALTRFFLRAGWPPNAVTMLSLFVGLVAAGCFAYGTYPAGLLGSLFFQFAAVLDCCDGDVARVTLGESRFGAFLDLWGDNVVHMAIFAGIAWAGSQQGWTLAPAAGAAAIVGNALSLWFVSRLTRQRDRRAQKTSPRAAWSEFILRNVASRDFSVFLLIFALLNALQWFLYLAAVGSNVFWMIAAWVSRPSWNRA
jgi:1L-myo-inositol 1-phosphate cytidylyltransferase / CDP-L-myo-inositol myo-inositolphosphotransferase